MGHHTRGRIISRHMLEFDRVLESKRNREEDRAEDREEDMLDKTKT